jgi:hypothetical protein
MGGRFLSFGDKPSHSRVLPRATANYPNLSKMAINILSILAMSSEPERVFSSAKNLFNDKRL